MLQLKKPTLSFQDQFIRMYPSDMPFPVRVVTFVVTHECNFRCTYCYENGKCNEVMSFETAKKAVDILFDNEKNTYINDQNASAVILDFIGGEPLLEIDLINQIVEYFKYKAAMLKHPWAIQYMISMTSNGSLYNTPKVQNFLKRHKGRVSITITIDGNKELHDSCRKFKNGDPTYDIVEKAIKLQIKQQNSVSTKLTLAPSNISYLCDAMINLINLGLSDVHANCVFEKGWEIEHAKIMYQEMKKLADYIIDNDIYTKFNTSLFSDTIGSPMSPDDNKNYCGGTGLMLAVDIDGNFYPCLRYTPFSLNGKVKPMIIGNVYNGIAISSKEKDCINCLNCITRRSQSTDECFNCPIASGCAYCSAYNYEDTGTPNKRVTYICDMHKARCLSTAYYFNKLYKKLGMPDRFIMNVPKEWALKIISEDEFNMLQAMSKD
jgi:uncharacterized protein